ncbi:hypothetical protein L3i22_099630 [Actinoplanes sp. L3-i22]|nr:hypothetical protein L3i22_099630 [Actinoplanes sp. L3-i22]
MLVAADPESIVDGFPGASERVRSLGRGKPVGWIVPIYAPTTADGKPITSDISIRECCMNASLALSTASEEERAACLI